ncbi:MAG: transposase [Sphingobacteriales bacterium]|nr:transposase [Sphingobacteriales bacterium]
MYTIMTNAQSGKIALLAQTMKPEELKQVMEHYLSQVLEEVKSVSCDMSPSYKKLCKDIFPNTQLVIDKFHVIKHLLDALQQVRKQLKTQYINQETILVKADTDEQQTHWSYIELLERSRYILFKMQDEWEEDELEIMQQLFYRFPILETAYRITQKLRLWYQGKNIGKSMDKIEQELLQLVR